jgi:hypothetical protein
VLQLRLASPLAGSQEFVHRLDRLRRLAQIVVQHGDVVHHPGIGVDPPQPLHVPKRFGIMSGLVMDLGQQFYRASVIGIEDEGLPQETVRGGNVAGTACANGIAIQVSSLLAVELALFFGPALAQGLLAALLGSRLRHAGLGSR